MDISASQTKEKNLLATSLDLDSRDPDQISFQAPTQLLVVHFPTFSNYFLVPPDLSRIDWWLYPILGWHDPCFTAEMRRWGICFYWNLAARFEHPMNFIRTRSKKYRIGFSLNRLSFIRNSVGICPCIALDSGLVYGRYLHFLPVPDTWHFLKIIRIPSQSTESTPLLMS